MLRASCVLNLDLVICREHVHEDLFRLQNEVDTKDFFFGRKKKERMMRYV